MCAHCDLCVLIVGVFVGAGVFMRARRVLVCIHCICYSLYMLLIVCLFREIGKWDLGGMGNGLLNGLIGELEIRGMGV